MTHRGSARRTWLSILAAIILSAAAWSAAQPDAANASCKYGGDSYGGCMPGGGYTLDRYWNCGAIYQSHTCYQPGTTYSSSAHSHTWGWGSADYDGSGSVHLKVETADFYGIGYNITRACFYASGCGDQSSASSMMWVRNLETNGSRHTIYGHGKA